ncbi:YbaB/EbfC family nucleoid-associated protein [Jidongwangia harbinensis]|uniref:YbaB/EbfC family nucleoid-associated protein n=1 Tax=Jidongwangia harbinensis TaxID=2878561 RepID=UPI001CDA3940|nr:YbaB/EbfC family nucleoid-associated protein [Jidongwangia harbinensis]MCA2215377.1 YbaB/EbfC family nucleoid-associated protein [Jidongwangia harbinensis]
MFDGRDLDEVARFANDERSGVAAHAATTRALSKRLASLTASARSDDGLVRVTVGPSGLVTDLELAEGIRRLPAAETALLILRTMRTAQSALAALATSVTTETVGAGSATGMAIIESYTARLQPFDE